MTYEQCIDTQQQISLNLVKTCDENDVATWRVSFELREGNPLVTVASISVELDQEFHTKAAATAEDRLGLDECQAAQAQIAADFATDPDADDDDKRWAVQQIIAVRERGLAELGRLSQ